MMNIKASLATKTILAISYMLYLNLMFGCSFCPDTKLANACTTRGADICSKACIAYTRVISTHAFIFAQLFYGTKAAHANTAIAISLS